MCLTYIFVFSIDPMYTHIHSPASYLPLSLSLSFSQMDAERIDAVSWRLLAVTLVLLALSLFNTREVSSPLTQEQSAIQDRRAILFTHVSAAMKTICDSAMSQRTVCEAVSVKYEKDVFVKEAVYFDQCRTRQQECVAADRAPRECAEQSRDCLFQLPAYLQTFASDTLWPALGLVINS